MRTLAAFCVSLLLSASPSSSAAVQNAREIRDAKDHYRRWLEQDVAYIITPEEKGVFQKLQTDEERDGFIEQFWLRRDRDPATPENEFKEEHYRRIQYANEHFHAGIPGWKTDRGRVYIRFGKPDRIESHPAGGSYQRKPHEGGGRTSTYPFEVWEYRHIDGVGDDIELEFVNDAGGNLYRLTMDPQDKDELLRVPGMGLTDAEMFRFGGRKSFDRVNRIREYGEARNQGIYFERARDQPFQKAELLMRLSKPPVIRFDDLKAKVASRVTYDMLRFRVASHFIRAGPQSFIVPVTLSFDPADIALRREGEVVRSRLQVYGLVSTLTRRAVFEFDDEIVAEHTDMQSLRTRPPEIYQRKLALRPGRYKLELVVKDTVSGRIGSQAVGLEVPAPPEDRLSTSSLILTRSIEPSGDDWSSPYVVGSYKVKPQVDSVFHAGGDLGFFVEAYNFSLDPSAQKPVLQIRYGIAAKGKEPASYRPITRGVTLAGDRVYIARMIQLGALEKGPHEIVFSMTDALSGQSATTRAPFEIR